MSTILSVQNIEKYYGNKGNVTKAVDQISFDVSEGEYVGIMGASGSGKTTLLNCISTIDTVTSGHIYIGASDITTLNSKSLSRFRREQLGFIFQDFNLLDTLTAFENIALALTIIKTPSAEIIERVKNVAAKLEIGDVLNKYPYQMSGGQKQRVACARAIITNPSLILADEPTGNLDSASGKEIMDIIQGLWKAGNTIVLITHDTQVADQAQRKIYVRDGKVSGKEPAL